MRPSFPSRCLLKPAAGCPTRAAVVDLSVTSASRNGKLWHKGCGNNHKTSTKNRARKNRIREGGFTTDQAAKTIKKFLGKSTKA